jgi:hypothetical protein
MERIDFMSFYNWLDTLKIEALGQRTKEKDSLLASVTTNPVSVMIHPRNAWSRPGLGSINPLLKLGESRSSTWSEAGSALMLEKVSSVIAIVK